MLGEYPTEAGVAHEGIPLLGAEPFLFGHGSDFQAKVTVAHRLFHSRFASCRAVSLGVAARLTQRELAVKAGMSIAAPRDWEQAAGACLRPDTLAGEARRWDPGAVQLAIGGS